MQISAKYTVRLIPIEPVIFEVVGKNTSLNIFPFIMSNSTFKVNEIFIE